MPLEIYVDQLEPFQSSTVNLDGVDYELRVRYSQREDRYYLSLYTIDQVPIVAGVKIVLEFPLLRGDPQNAPPGQLIALSNEDADDTSPGLGELGTKDSGARVQLIYITQAEILASSGEA